MSGLVLPFIVVLALALLIERAAARRGTRTSPAAFPARALALAGLGALWLGIFDRPWLAALATLITVTALTAISHRKRHLVGEPLVFSDFGLIRLAIRHPDLYYTEVLTSPPALGAFAVLVASLAAFLWLEPPLLPGLGALAVLVAVASLAAILWVGARRSALAGWLRARVPMPDLEQDVARWGLLLTLVVHALRWRADLDLPYPSLSGNGCLDHLGLVRGGASPDLVVVVQIESFMDPSRRLREPPLPGLAAARERALLSGPLRVPAHGAYTMRSEFAVLSGLSPEALGLRGADPYLSAVAGTVAPPTIASRLRAAGWETLFVHPFRPGFFDRDRALPGLGFARFLWDADFAPTDRAGPYTGDPALIRRLLAEAARHEQIARGRPLFVMAVTMENHGPWPPGRLPSGTDARAQYLTHLASSDLAVTELIAGLAERPGRALLCLYGDHPPILPCLESSAVPETDYVILELGRDAPARAGTGPVPLAADELGRVLTSLCVPGASGEALPA